MASIRLPRLALLFLAIICGECRALSPPVAPIGINGFSGFEALITFGGFSDISDSLTVDGVTFTDETDGFIVLQDGGAIPDTFFGNIPGASKGGYGKTTATPRLKLLIELPTPARRFGMLVSTGGPQSYQVTAIASGIDLGSVIATQPGQSQAVFAGIQSTTPFQQVRIEETTHGGMSSAFDDARFEFVPEPSSAVSFAAAFCIITFARRQLRRH
jgi:hypothetical protein